jgi:signal transduction histidine kinase
MGGSGIAPLWLVVGFFDVVTGHLTCSSLSGPLVPRQPDLGNYCVGQVIARRIVLVVVMDAAREKIEVAMRALRAEGHVVEVQLDGGKTWFEINHRMRASAEEMQNLADGLYSLSELEELFIERSIENTSPDELAEGVINEWAMYAQTGHAKDLTAEFRELAERALEFRSAGQWLENQRRSFELIAGPSDQPPADALLEQPSARERTAREAFLTTYKEYFHKRLASPNQ